MYEDIYALLKELAEFDLEAVLASISEPPVEVLLMEIQDSTEQIFQAFRVP